MLVCFDLPSRSEQLGPLRICWRVCVCVWAYTAEKLQLWFCTPEVHNWISSWQENVTVMITETKSSHYVQKLIFFTVCQLLQFNSYLCCPQLDCNI